MSVPFNPTRGLIRVRTEITGPAGIVVVYLALATGAIGTVIRRARLRLAGHDPVSIGTAIQITTVSQVVQAFRMPVDSLDALGQTRSKFPVVAHDLPAGVSVDGVLGLDFLRGQVLTLDFPNGEITLTSGAPTP